MPYDPGGTQTHRIKLEAMIVVALDNHNMNTTSQCHTTRSNLVHLDHIRTQNTDERTCGDCVVNFTNAKTPQVSPQVMVVSIW